MKFMFILKYLKRVGIRLCCVCRFHGNRGEFRRGEITCGEVEVLIRVLECVIVDMFFKFKREEAHLIRFTCFFIFCICVDQHLGNYTNRHCVSAGARRERRCMSAP